jgi:hypothetical protein
MLNRQEWIAAADLQLSQDKCEPSSIWLRRRAQQEKAGQ